MQLNSHTHTCSDLVIFQCLTEQHLFFFSCINIVIIYGSSSGYSLVSPPFERQNTKLLKYNFSSLWYFRLYLIP